MCHSMTINHNQEMEHLDIQVNLKEIGENQPILNPPNRDLGHVCFWLFLENFSGVVKIEVD